MRISPLDFSQARLAPDSVMRGLEELDPTACVVHLGGTRWVVGKVRPNADVRAQAGGMFDNWTRAVRNGAKLSEQAKQRVRFAQLALLGFRPVDTYSIVGEPDGRIVQDFARSRFRWLHAGNDALFQQMDDAEQERRDANNREIGSIDRAKDAHSYAFNLSHRMGTSLTPPDLPKSGWKREMSVA